ncbi:NfeD family protein [Oscillatoria sp. FACHB-1407]|uniref:NfeD family protein n=1 Tax=Oscillatoria sp. FACHB-1407 TaxID=2692847 RepID=UPI0016849F1B|nr:NfeD family protein [Oscillatoria sp. FACHB-1407]MBD2459911.1 NfeD family protein [Oscillatoria sp. FACHB-1407]
MFNPLKTLESLFSSSDTQTVPNFSAPLFGVNATDKERQALVDQPIQPGAPGRVKFQGSWWPARCEKNLRLMQGEIVRVVGVRNITLLVEPVSSLQF